MSHVANPFVVVLDANVLYPVRTRDVLFTFGQQGLFRARFTEQILDEWTRSLVRNKPELEESVLRQAGIIREVFEECFVTGYGPLVAGLNLPDPDGRHVLAAAIPCSAQTIVTENRRHFPDEVLKRAWRRGMQRRRHAGQHVRPVPDPWCSRLADREAPLSVSGLLGIRVPS